MHFLCWNPHLLTQKCWLIPENSGLSGDHKDLGCWIRRLNISVLLPDSTLLAYGEVGCSEVNIGVPVYAWCITSIYRHCGLLVGTPVMQLDLTEVATFRYDQSCLITTGDMFRTTCGNGPLIHWKCGLKMCWSNRMRRMWNSRYDGMKVTFRGYICSLFLQCSAAFWRHCGKKL